MFLVPHYLLFIGLQLSYPGSSKNNAIFTLYADVMAKISAN